MKSINKQENVDVDIDNLDSAHVHENIGLEDSQLSIEDSIIVGDEKLSEIIDAQQPKLVPIVAHNDCLHE